MQWGTHSKENIELLIEAISGDQYDSDAQGAAGGGAQNGGLPDDLVYLIDSTLSAHASLLPEKMRCLELGIGQWPFRNPWVTDAVDASITMVERLRVKLQETPCGLDPENLHHAVTESLSPDWSGSFDAALFINGFFQVRSDYEALIELNRVLKLGGLLMFNLYSNDKADLICGRCYGPRNYIRVVEEFGFKQLAWHREVGRGQGVYGGHLLVFEKVNAFRIANLRKLQLVSTGTGVYRANNLDVEGRDRRYV